MEEADKGWMMIKIVIGTGSPG